MTMSITVKVDNLQVNTVERHLCELTFMYSGISEVDSRPK